MIHFTGGLRHSNHIYEDALVDIFNEGTIEADEEFERKYGAVNTYR